MASAETRGAKGFDLGKKFLHVPAKRFFAVVNTGDELKRGAKRAGLFDSTVDADRVESPHAIASLETELIDSAALDVAEGLDLANEFSP